MYREISVWERMSAGGLVRYRCLESLSDGRFCVQSADFYRESRDYKEQNQEFFNQFVTLFAEDFPEVRSKMFKSLQEAIDAHKREFDEA